MLLKHTSYNLLGLGIPLISAVVSIPILLHSLGSDRFGLLTLIWAVVSYFGLFDLGLGRALTKQLSMLFALNENEKVGSLVATSTVLMALLGIASGVLLAVLAPWGIGLISGVPNQNEAIYAVYAMALSMPAIVLTSGFRGILEAKHAFATVNLIRLPMGLFTFLGPVLVVIYGQPRLDWIALVLGLGRVIACVVHAWYAWKVLPHNRGDLVIRTNLLKPLWVTGGWLTVSNIISPLMGYVDRFLLSSIVSAGAVAYYVTPQELMTKLWIIPGALTMVLFPTFAAQATKRDEETWKLFKKAVRWLFVALLPIISTVVLFSNEILSLWISQAFASQSSMLLQIFAVGILVSCLTHIPFVLIQSAGSPRLTAFVHLTELPFFLGLLWILTSNYGTLGAACAWLTRTIIDALVVFALSAPLLGQSVRKFFNVKVLALMFLVVIIFSGIFIESGILRALWLIVLLVMFSLSLLPKKRLSAQSNKK